MIAAFFISALLGGVAADQIDWKHPYGNPVKLVNGGLCVGLAWVKLLPGEVPTVDYGPDFNVYRVRGPGKAEWGAYSGFAAQSTPDIHRILLTKDRVTVFRGTGDGTFDGYFVGVEGSQNHFFGTVFNDSPSDARFFARVSFGAPANAECESKRQ
jgi:hypothetical protein